MSSININKLLDQRRLLSHLLFLLLALSIVVFYWLMGSGPSSFSDRFEVALLIFIFLETFIFFSRIFFRDMGTDVTSKAFAGKILFRFALFYVACFIAAFIISIAFKLVFSLKNHQAISQILSDFFQYNFKDWLASTLKGLSFGAVVFLLFQWLEALKKARKLKEDNLIFQNETLKNQVNPHFLFNSLNTLSSLVSTHADQAEEYINRLASIYRYILDNSAKDKVLLQAEINFIRDYFDLHKIRGEEKIQLELNVPFADEYAILPVSLQILIENAIKHNMATREKPLVISVELKDNSIEVRNNLQKMVVVQSSTKIGLKNLADRIKLATGKELIITETNTEFIVKVPLL